MDRIVASACADKLYHVLPVSESSNRIKVNWRNCTFSKSRFSVVPFVLGGDNSKVSLYSINDHSIKIIYLIDSIF
mgnify:CR=1 FL=1